MRGLTSTHGHRRGLNSRAREAASGPVERIQMAKTKASGLVECTPVEHDFCLIPVMAIGQPQRIYCRKCGKVISV